MAVKGRRLPDTPQGQFPVRYHQLRDGDYWKLLDPATGEPLQSDSPTNLTHTVWFVVAPGLLLANLTAHTVREEDDGTISVRPGDGSSNSILVTRRPEETWHGHIEHGVWREC